jgi:hypothetical protein
MLASSIWRNCLRRTWKIEMTLFYSHQDTLRDRTAASRSPIASWWRILQGRRLMRRAVGRAAAVLRFLHGAIMTAKMRRIQRELMLQIALRDEWPMKPDSDQCDPEKAAAKFPQQPLIFGDKWDF